MKYYLTKGFKTGKIILWELLPGYPERYNRLRVFKNPDMFTPVQSVSGGYIRANLITASDDRVELEAIAILEAL